VELEARQAQMQQRIAVEQQLKKELAECTFKPKVSAFSMCKLISILNACDRRSPRHRTTRL
jgi:hypothetical protein